MPRSAHSARSSPKDCRMEQMAFTESRGWDTSVPAAGRQLWREELVQVAEFDRDQPVVVRDAPALRGAHQAGRLDAETLVELPGPRAYAVVHGTDVGDHMGAVTVDDRSHGGDVVIGN